MSLSHEARRRRRAVFSPDRLEDRRLLSGTTASKFAVYQGKLVTQSSDAFTVTIDQGGFTPARNRQVLLKVETRATDGGLDPAAADVASSNPRGLQVLSKRDDAGSSNEGVTIVAASPGALTIRPKAEGATQGGYSVEVSLAGDVNGDFKVDRTDLAAIRAAIPRRGATTSPTTPSAYDVDGDGKVDQRDWSLASRNLGAATSFRPLTSTAAVAPADDPNGDGVVDGDKSTVGLVGKTRAGSVVKLDRNNDGTFDQTTTAAADGSYRFDVPLALGANTVRVSSQSADGQVVVSSLTITRGTTAAQIVASSTDFRQGAQGWSADFADVPVDANDSYELDSGIRDLPTDLDVDGTGYLLQSHNRSDDAFMYLTKKLTAADGVVAGQTYRAVFQITYASNAPSGSVGIGGAPGESVILKAGASSVEPKTVEVDGYERLNVDKGNQSEGGTAASVVGNIANGLEQTPDQTSVPYVSLTQTHVHTADVKADAQGNLWLIVGTDSGFEGLTALYFQNIAVALFPV